MSRLRKKIFSSTDVWSRSDAREVLSVIKLDGYMMSYIKSTHPEITFPQWYHLPTIQAHLLPWSPFLQHASQQWCNYPDILSFIKKILLFDSVFYSRVIHVSISTLKPLLGVIGAIPLKLWISPIVETCI